MVELQAESVKLVSTEPVHVDAESGALTNLVVIEMNRAVSFDAAQKTLSEHGGGDHPEAAGFWVSTYTNNHAGSGNPLVMMALRREAQENFRLVRPNRAQSAPMPRADVSKNYRFAGRDYRLTDVHGTVVKSIIG